MNGLVGFIVVFVFIIAITSIKIVNQSHTGIVERLGTFHKLMKPGINLVFPCL